MKNAHFYRKYPETGFRNPYHQNYAKNFMAHPSSVPLSLRIAGLLSCANPAPRELKCTAHLSKL